MGRALLAPLTWNSPTDGDFNNPANDVYTLMAVGDVGADGSFTTRIYKKFTPGTYRLVAVAFNALGSGPTGSPFSLTVVA